MERCWKHAIDDEQEKISDVPYLLLIQVFQAVKMGKAWKEFQLSYNVLYIFSVSQKEELGQEKCK